MPRMKVPGRRYDKPEIGRWLSHGKRRETGMEQAVKVRHGEGIASHTGPELCVGDWQQRGEALAGEPQGRY
ncbi:MAG: hypothetical protein AAB403_12330 [Planctomycetota bacterium]